MGYPLDDMPDDPPDPLDADPLYRNYLLVPRERVQKSIGERAAAFERGGGPWH